MKPSVLSFLARASAFSASDVTTIWTQRASSPCFAAAGSFAGTGADAAFRVGTAVGSGASSTIFGSSTGAARSSGADVFGTFVAGGTGVAASKPIGASVGSGVAFSPRPSGSGRRHGDVRLCREGRDRVHPSLRRGSRLHPEEEREPERGQEAEKERGGLPARHRDLVVNRPVLLLGHFSPSSSALPAFCSFIPRRASISMGTGKRIVEFFSAAISVSVCR